MKNEYALPMAFSKHRFTLRLLVLFVVVLPLVDVNSYSFTLQSF